ncbi:hypothetical protein JL720_4122 [Aureococcus anophagefferens]|nr:hypothetical protein JL720_4122 [Aureococcus anophagefferens]
MMQAMLLGDHVEPSYTSRVSRLLGVDGESVFLASISDSFCDAERTLKILGHFTPILAEYVVTMRTVNKLREEHADDDERYRVERDKVLDAQHEQAGPAVGAMYDDLGSVYLKTAQFAAAQGTLLPPAFEKHLQFAFQNARKRPWAAVDATAAGDLGADYRGKFLSLDETPLAAASIGQVHRGVLKAPAPRRAKGEKPFQDVAVKVIYDDVRRNLVMDLKNQRILCEQVNAILELHMEATIVAILDEVEANLPLELDFTLEVRNMERQGSKRERAAALFRKRGFGDVVIPAAVPGLCSESVLVQEFLPGTTLAAYAAKAASPPPSPPRTRLERERSYSDDDADGGADDENAAPPPPPTTGDAAVERNLLRVVDAIGATLFLDGFFHADAHPGNVLVLDGSRNVALIDWGQCAELKPAQVASVARLVLLLNTRSRDVLDACFEADGLSSAALADRYAFSNLEESGLDAAARTALLYQFFDSTSDDAGVDKEVFDRLSYMIQHDISNVPIRAEIKSSTRLQSARPALRPRPGRGPPAAGAAAGPRLDPARRGLEDDRVPAAQRAAAFLDRERAALDADPERFFRGLLEGADLRSRLFGHARSDWVHGVGYGADAVRGFAAFLDDGARVARAKRAAAVGAVVVGGLVLARACALLA